MSKEIKIALLVGAVLGALIIDWRLQASGHLLFFLMAGLIPVAIIWLTFYVLKSEVSTPSKVFREDQPDSWYDQP